MLTWGIARDRRHTDLDVQLCTFLSGSQHPDLHPVEVAYGGDVIAAVTALLHLGIHGVRYEDQSLRSE
jgi:hypothetical protein